MENFLTIFRRDKNGGLELFSKTIARGAFGVLFWGCEQCFGEGQENFWRGDGKSPCEVGEME